MKDIWVKQCPVVLNIKETLINLAEEDISTEQLAIRIYENLSDHYFFADSKELSDNFEKGILEMNIQKNIGILNPHKEENV